MVWTVDLVPTSFSYSKSRGNIWLTTKIGFKADVQPIFTLAKLKALKLLNTLQSTTIQSLIFDPHSYTVIFITTYAETGIMAQYFITSYMASEPRI
jgi:hypothetical protein